MTPEGTDEHLMMSISSAEAARLLASPGSRAWVNAEAAESVPHSQDLGGWGIRKPAEVVYIVCLVH